MSGGPQPEIFSRMAGYYKQNGRVFAIPPAGQVDSFSRMRISQLAAIAALGIIVGTPVLEGLLFCPECKVITLNPPGALVEDDHAYGFISAVLEDSSDHGRILC